MQTTNQNGIFFHFSNEDSDDILFKIKYTTNTTIDKFIHFDLVQDIISYTKTNKKGFIKFNPLKVKYEDVTYCISFYENVHQNYESIYDKRTDLYFTHQCIEEHYNDSPIKMNFYLEGKSIQNPIAVLSIQYLYESTGEEFHFAYHPKILKESDIKVTKIPYNYFKTVFFNDYETVMCSLQKENLKDPFFVIDISYTTELKTVQ